jgi:hypothetical protein
MKKLLMSEVDTVELADRYRTRLKLRFKLLEISYL